MFFILYKESLYSLYSSIGITLASRRKGFKGIVLLLAFWHFGNKLSELSFLHKFNIHNIQYWAEKNSIGWVEGGGLKSCFKSCDANLKKKFQIILPNIFFTL